MIKVRKPEVEKVKEVRMTERRASRRRFKKLKTRETTAYVTELFTRLRLWDLRK